METLDDFPHFYRVFQACLSCASTQDPRITSPLKMGILLLLFLFILCFVGNIVSFCSSGWLGTYRVDQSSLPQIHSNSPASSLRVL